MSTPARFPPLDRQRSFAPASPQPGEAPIFEVAPLLTRSCPESDGLYRLVEIHAAEGWWEEEVFVAPDDETAWNRVLEATTGEFIALWRADHLVRMLTPLVEPFEATAVAWDGRGRANPFDA